MPTSIERINQKFNKLNKVGAHRPKKVDLRAHMTRIENQGKIGLTKCKGKMLKQMHPNAQARMPVLQFDAKIDRKFYNKRKR